MCGSATGSVRSNTQRAKRAHNTHLRSAFRGNWVTLVSIGVRLALKHSPLEDLTESKALESQLILVNQIRFARFHRNLTRYKINVVLIPVYAAPN